MIESVRLLCLLAAGWLSNNSKGYNTCPSKSVWRKRL